MYIYTKFTNETTSKLCPFGCKMFEVLCNDLRKMVNDDKPGDVLCN